MKRSEVIDRLKKGDKIVAVGGFKPSARFCGSTSEVFGATVRYDTVQWLEKSGLVDIEESKTACNLRYITWKDEGKLGARVG